jgi:hypothetical protein
MEEQLILYLRNKGYSEEQIQAVIQMGNQDIQIPSAATQISQKWSTGEPFSSVGERGEYPAIEKIPTLTPKLEYDNSRLTDSLNQTQNAAIAPLSFKSKLGKAGYKMAGASDVIGIGTEIGSAAMSMGFAKDGRLTDREAGLSSAVKWGGRGLQIGSNPALMAATGGLSAPLGAALGAIGGGIGGGIHNKNMRNKDSAFQTDMLQQGKANMMDMYKAKAPSAVPNMYQKNGVNSYGSYAYGGSTNSAYEVEGGEVMMQTGDQKPMALNGGYMNSISPTMQEIKGKSHKNGGVNAINDGFVFSNRLKTDNSKYLKRL